MLYLSGFELYSRWVPLDIVANPDNVYFSFQRQLIKLLVIVKQIIMCTACMEVL